MTIAADIFPPRVLDKVVHLKRDDYDVRIDRQTKWGNPHRLSDYDSRAECLMAYLEWLGSQFGKEDGIIGSIDELRGKTLGCWCAPKLCHGHVLAAMAMTADKRGSVGWIAVQVQKVRQSQGADHD